MYLFVFVDTMFFFLAALLLQHTVCMVGVDSERRAVHVLLNVIVLVLHVWLVDICPSSEVGWGCKELLLCLR